MENIDPHTSNGHRVWMFIRRYVLNKYVIVLVSFAVFMTLIGNQSMIHHFERAHDIDSLKTVRDSLRKKIEHTEHRIQAITTDKDSLERFARERYYMHTQEEEVYIVPDNKQ